MIKSLEMQLVAEVERLRGELEIAEPYLEASDRERLKYRKALEKLRNKADVQGWVLSAELILITDEALGRGETP